MNHTMRQSTYGELQRFQEKALDKIDRLRTALNAMLRLYEQTGDHLPGNHEGLDCPYCNARAELRRP